MIDSTFRITAPPVEAAVTAHDQFVALVAIGIASLILVVALAVAVRDWKRSGTPIALLLIVAGGVAFFAEPMVDLLGGCWHPAHGQDALFSLIDRPMPLWVLFPYITYFGVSAMFTYLAFVNGVSTRTMWKWFLVPVVCDIAMEESLLTLSDNLYIYYANQPLRLHNFPLWWAAPNTFGIYLSGVIVALTAQHLRGWRLGLVPFSILMCYVASAGIVGFPSFMVINSSAPFWVTQLGGIGSFVMAGMLVHFCTVLCANDSPYNIRQSLLPPTRLSTSTG